MKFNKKISLRFICTIQDLVSYCGITEQLQQNFLLLISKIHNTKLLPKEYVKIQSTFPWGLKAVTCLLLFCGWYLMLSLSYLLTESTKNCIWLHISEWAHVWSKSKPPYKGKPSGLIEWSVEKLKVTAFKYKLLHLCQTFHGLKFFGHVLFLCLPLPRSLFLL